jgi:hypothetical protein
MKKINAVLSVLCMLLFLTTARAQSTNENSLEGRARGAAHECLQQYNGNYDITATTDVTGICFVQGFTYRVTFTARPKCSGPGACPFFAVLVASVDFGCEGELIGVTCY